jgi:hypothetical protein
MAQFYEKAQFSGELSTLQNGLQAKTAVLYTFQFSAKNNTLAQVKS